MANGAGPLLEVDQLQVELLANRQAIPILTSVSLQVDSGETLGIVGESGSGKTLTALSIMRLLPKELFRVTGRIRFQGTDLLRAAHRDIRSIRGSEVSMIFQEAAASLNPAFTVGEQISEVLRKNLGLRRRESFRRSIELLDMVGIPTPEKRIHDYPFAFSGGMAQRVMIAIAIACQPRLLIADEPTTALDVTIQDQVLRLLVDLQHQMGMAILFVTHDLGVAARMCDKIAVMYAGEIVEVAPVIPLFERPRHPYTAGLLHSHPSDTRAHPLEPIPGTTPTAGAYPQGCRFNPRCPHRIDGRCTVNTMELTRIESHRLVRCALAPSLNLLGIVE